MTAILGFVGEKNYYLAADKRASNWCEHKNIEDSKIFKFKDFMIGVAGRVAIINCLEYWNPPKRKRNESINDYIKKTIRNSLKKLVVDNGIVAKDKGVIESLESEILIATADGLYVIQEDFSIYELQQNYFGIGSGGNHGTGALGMIYYLVDYKQITEATEEDAIRQAMYIVSQNARGVSYECKVFKEKR